MSALPQRPTAYEEALFLPQGFKLVPSQNVTKLKIDYDFESDGRVIADIEAVPGAIAWDKDKTKAALKAIGIAYKILLDEVAHGERPASSIANIQIDGLQ